MAPSVPHNLKLGFNILRDAIFHFTDFNSPVDFFPAIAIAFFIYKTFIFFWKASRISNELKDGIDRLSPFKRNEGELPETVLKISHIFNDPNISQILDEFKESLVIYEDGEKKRYRNTLDSNHFFNYDSICRRLDFYSSVPGILTGLAILGTFIGIIYGLHNSNIAEAIKNTGDQAGTEMFGESIKIFLNGLGEAFAASVWGLTLALCFTYLERFRTTGIEELISKFNHRVNLIFPRQTSEELLLKIVADGQSQLSALHAMANDISSNIVASLTDGGINTVEISSSVQKGIQSGFEGLGTRLKELNEFHDKYFSGVKVLFDDLKGISDTISVASKANEVAGKASESTAANLTFAGENIFKASSAAASIVTSVKAQSDYLSSLSKDFQAVSERLATSSREMVTEVKVVSGHFKEQSDALSTMVVKTSDGLKGGFKAIDEQMGSVVSQLGGAVGGVNKHLESLVERVVEFDSKLNQKAERSDIAKMENNLAELRRTTDELKGPKVG